MKARELFHDENPVWKMLPPWGKAVIKHIHQLQIDMEVLMTAHLATQEQVVKNTAYVNKKKYITPYGDFSTYSKAAAAEPKDGQGNAVKWTVIRSRIKDENQKEYFLNV